MPFAVITTTNARLDIQEAISWENRRKPGLGARFLTDLEQILRVIAQTPQLGAIRYENVRCIPTHVFQYLVHYLDDDINKQIIILRVLHTSRKPVW